MTSNKYKSETAIKKNHTYLLGYFKRWKSCMCVDALAHCILKEVFKGKLTVLKTLSRNINDNTVFSLNADRICKYFALI